MADDIEQSAFDVQSFDIVLQDLEGETSNILKKLKNTSRSDVTTELYSKIDTKVLCETRLSLFETAVGLYDEQLALAGQLGKASLVLVDRRGDRRAENLSKDIISLVCYNARLKSEFPRDITSSKSVYVTLAESSGAQSNQSSKTPLPTHADGQVYTSEQMIELLLKRVNELEATNKKQWEYIYNVEKVMNIQTEDKAQEKEKEKSGSSDNPKPDTEESQTDNGPPAGQPRPEKTKKKKTSKGKSSKKKENESESKSQPSYSQIMKETDSEQSDASDTETQDDSSADEEHETSGDESERKDATQRGKNTKNEDKSWGTAGPKGTKRLNKNEKKESKKKISGMAQEQSVCLYVQNIRRDSGTTMGEIASLVKSHLKENDVRCLYARAIRNKYVDDTVGCKIVVPLRQKDEVIGIKIWPDNVRCREWAGNWDESGDSIARNFGENDENQGSGLMGSDKPRRGRGFRRRYDNHFNFTPAPWYGHYNNRFW